MEITFEQFRNRFRSTSNNMLSDYDCEHVKTDKDRMMILVMPENTPTKATADKILFSNSFILLSSNLPKQKCECRECQVYRPQRQPDYVTLLCRFWTRTSYQTGALFQSLVLTVSRLILYPFCKVRPKH